MGKKNKSKMAGPQLVTQPTPAINSARANSSAPMKAVEDIKGDAGGIDKKKRKRKHKEQKENLEKKVKVGHNKVVLPHLQGGDTPTVTSASRDNKANLQTVAKEVVQKPLPALPTLPPTGPVLKTNSVKADSNATASNDKNSKEVFANTAKPTLSNSKTTSKRAVDALKETNPSLIASDHSVSTDLISVTNNIATITRAGINCLSKDKLDEVIRRMGLNKQLHALKRTAATMEEQIKAEMGLKAYKSENLDFGMTG